MLWLEHSNLLASAMQAYLSRLLDFTGSVVPQGKGLLLEKLKQSAMHPATKLLHLRKSSTGTNAASSAHCPPDTQTAKVRLSFWDILPSIAGS